MEIGFIGLGKMGFPMARRLIEAKHQLTVFDTRKEAVHKLVAMGAQAATSPKDIADRCETVMASLPSLQASLEVATGSGGVIDGKRVKRFIDLSTVGSHMATKIHGLLAKKNIVQLDSPVSGGVGGAEKGTLAVMVSGPRADYETAKPALDVIGKVFFIGEKPGSAQTMKLANNFLSATADRGNLRSRGDGRQGGPRSVTVMIDVINSGSGLNTASRDKFPRAILPRSIRLRFCDRPDGEGRPAGAGRNEIARSVDGSRRSRGKTVGSHHQGPGPGQRFHRCDQADREGGGGRGGRCQGRQHGEVTSPGYCVQSPLGIPTLRHCDPSDRASIAAHDRK